MMLLQLKSFFQATNSHGEATVSCKLQVRGRQGVVLEPQIPNIFLNATEHIQKLEESLHRREELRAEEEEAIPPRFMTEISVKCFLNQIVLLSNDDDHFMILDKNLST